MLKSKKYVLRIFIIVLLASLFAIYIFNNRKEKDSFDWKIAEGQSIQIYLNQHPYSEAIIKSIPEFEYLTGIDVEYFISPENVYFEKHMHYITSKTSNIDVIMTGPYYVWRTAQTSYIESLDNYINDKNITHPKFDIDDFHPNILDVMRWNPKSNTNYENSELWAIPIGFELDAIVYNKKLFKDLNITPPDNFNDLSALITILKEKGISPIGVRGLDSWTSIASSYINFFYNYGLSEFEIEDNRLKPVFNSPKSIEFHEKWINMLKTGVTNDWKKSSWYNLSADVGAGKVAMIFDFDNVGYYQNISNIAKEKGNLGVAPIPSFSNENSATHIWSWGLAMRKDSKNKLASWIFMQYFSSKDFFTNAVKNYYYLSPPRTSVLESKYFAEKVPKEFRTHLKEDLENAKIVLTHQPHSIEVMEVWITHLRKMYDNEFDSIEDGLNSLNNEVENIIKDYIVEKGR